MLEEFEFYLEERTEGIFTSAEGKETNVWERENSTK